MANNSHKNDITHQVMKDIHSGQVKMRPKIYFLAGSLILGIGLASALITAIFFLAVTTHNLRTYSPYSFLLFGKLGIRPFLSFIPWVPIITTTVGILGGIHLLKKYDISYKKSFTGIVIALITAIIIVGYAVDKAGFNDHLQKIRPIHTLYLKESIRDDLIVGTISSRSASLLELSSPEGFPVQVIWNEHTALPHGSTFQTGDMIRVIGEWHGATFSAVGIIKGPRHTPPAFRNPEVRGEFHDRMMRYMHQR